MTKRRADARTAERLVVSIREQANEGSQVLTLKCGHTRVVPVERDHPVGTGIRCFVCVPHG